MIWMFLLTAAGYLLGSIPFGVLIGKSIKGIDIRDVGSGNIGTANAIRALGPFWGGLVFAGDFLKGALSALIVIGTAHYYPNLLPTDLLNLLMCLTGLAAILGHNQSIFLGFKGGKGIATSFGVFLVLNWKAAIISFLLWLIFVIITKYSSLGSLAGSLALPISIYLLKSPVEHVIFAIIASVYAFYKHRENIKRLLKGEERKLGSEKDKKKNHTESKSASDEDLQSSQVSQ